ncbi:hypothetical protein GLOIN_2v1694915 [Rhizophagus irregularis DAOM 181602=DAOM 197198]|nr:hypothetical protein GLOIN_2v1694915 [Rhizophagus irregularis DAOM 181602=DAOM 197198]POG62620.1 hypothetical protein GLOIN_2v1694915 [Rhizophagus irregularis DAOM 181602=DAOM 197198]|eukprot:XP_025169486.1 hypothetical protein GLOIN_2v1694915 [Rhizophagus irregularis DAOM 181602=DAOM 197198]
MSPLKAFSYLTCGHIFHRLCIEKKLFLGTPIKLMPLVSFPIRQYLIPERHLNQVEFHLYPT